MSDGSGFWQLASPFLSALVVLMLGVLIGWRLQNNFKEKLEAAWHDGSANIYLLPAAFDKETIYARVARDSDTQTIPTAFASSVPPALAFIDTGDPIFWIAIGIGVTLPLASYLIIDGIYPLTYEKCMIGPVSSATIIVAIFFVVMIVFAFLSSSSAPGTPPQ